MTRKKKNQDILEDAKEAGTSLYDFVITQKVDAFVAAYHCYCWCKDTNFLANHNYSL